jgi:hypothetical protein
LSLAAALGALGWIEREPLGNVAWDLRWRYFPPAGAAAADDGADSAGIPVAAHVPLGAVPLEGTAIVAAEAAARRTLKSGGIGAAADASRRCFLALQEGPSLKRYDRCVAFDDAVLLIGGYGVADRGGFSAGSVTARQLAAGRIFDNDYGSIEKRLDRIRLEMMHRLTASPEPVEVAAADG